MPLFQYLMTVFLFIKLPLCQALWMAWYYFFGLGVVLVADMLGIDRHIVSRHFQYIKDAIIVAHVDVVAAKMIGGARKVLAYDETYYDNRYKVFGNICKSDGNFFIEQVEECTVNTLHEVIQRCIMKHSVVYTDAHVFYNNLREKMPGIVVEHHVVIHAKKNNNVVMV